MPKRIDDRSARTEHVYATVARIVGTEGVAAATVRRVAVEAGLSPAAIRHLWPSQERLHLRTVQWLVRNARGPLPWHDSDEEPIVRLRRTLQALLPSDETQRQRLRALAAFAATAAPGSTMSEVIEADHRQCVSLIARELRYYEVQTSDTPPPAIVQIVQGMRPIGPDSVPPSALSLLVLVEGLTALTTREHAPLSPDDADRWLGRLEHRHLDWGA